LLASLRDPRRGDARARRPESVGLLCERIPS
jgi:hypothetical protein